MKERTGSWERETSETRVAVQVNLDPEPQAGPQSDVDTGIPFFDHMLRALAAAGRFGLKVHARGDVQVDAHHTVEDAGLTLGRALGQAIGQGEGIGRYGWAAAPMDDALVEAVVDISGRAYAAVHGRLPERSLGGFHTDLVREWLWGLARGARWTIHLRILAGEDAHHMTEAAFKAMGLAVAQAVARRPGGIPSTKGALFT